MATQAGLDMSDGDAKVASGEGAPKCARGIALNHDEVGKVAAQYGRQRGGYLGGVAQRILDPDTTKVVTRQTSKIVIRGFQFRVLSGQDQMRRDPSCGERMGQRSKFNGLRTRSNDQLDKITAQRSP